MLKERISPDDIDVSEHFWSCFGQYEIEAQARHLVKKLQERGRGWEKYECPSDSYTLLDSWVDRDDNGITVTDAFVRRLPYTDAKAKGAK